MKTKTNEKGAMAKQLVYFCLRVLLYTAIWAMVVTTVALIFDRSIDLSPVLTFVATVFGGELLMLLVKRVFAKPTKEDEENGV